MRFYLPFNVRLRAALKERDWFGVAIEMLAVVLSVILGLEASQWSAQRAEAEYRRQIIAALDQSLVDFEVGGLTAHGMAATALATFRTELSEGRRPAPSDIALSQSRPSPHQGMGRDRVDGRRARSGPKGSFSACGAL